MVKDVYTTTGITATAGIGTNLYLAKIAMDIVAKHVDEVVDGVRLAELDEMSYRRLLWEHEPLTDFWRVGRGIGKKLASYGIHTMGDIARVSVSNYGRGSGEDFLYKLFGVDAELLIDHAWGIEPCTMADIKNYKPSVNSVSTGQVLSCGYDFEHGRIIVREMVELQVLELVAKHLVTDSVTLDIGYDRETKGVAYKGEMAKDPYGRSVPKPVHGSRKLKYHTSSTEQLIEAVLDIYDSKVDSGLEIRRVTISFGNVLEESKTVTDTYEQMNLFVDYAKQEADKQKQKKERNLQEAMLKIQSRYGKNAILKGTNLEEGATTIERNQQIGGHKA